MSSGPVTFISDCYEGLDIRQKVSTSQWEKLEPGDETMADKIFFTTYLTPPSFPRTSSNALICLFSLLQSEYPGILF